MYDNYHDFEIIICDICFPKSKLETDIVISTIKNKSEFNSVVKIYKEIFPNELDEIKGEELENMPFNSSNSSFIAKVQDNIVGFIITAPIDEKTLLLAYLGVIKEFRSKGVATKLLETLIFYMKQHEYEKICCTVNKHNIKTLNYIKILGFKKLIKDKK